MAIKVLKELKELIPAATEEEDRELEAWIKEDGVRDPLILGPKDVLLDGHRRFKFAKKHKKDFRVEIRHDLDTLQKQQAFMLRLQGSRRNVTARDRKLIIGRYYNLMSPGQGRKPDNLSGLTKSANDVAEEFDVNERTVRRNAKTAENVDKLARAVKTAYEDGSLKVSDKQLSTLAEMPKLDQVDAFNLVRKGGKQWSQVLDSKPASNGKNPKPKAKPKTRKQIHAERVKMFHKTLTKFAPVVDDYCEEAELTDAERKYWLDWYDEFEPLVVKFAKWRV